MAAAEADALFSLIKQKQDLQSYRERHWTGTLEDYLAIVIQNPRVARNSYQRLYDMILSHGFTEYTRHHERYVHYRLFDDPIDEGRDAVFGLDAPLMRLAHNVKSAAFGYGTEKRILLLHGPVGSSKSTIARLLKKGLELYSNKPEGALYTYGWKTDTSAGLDAVQWCPMHEDPLHLVPLESQESVYAELNRRLAPSDYRLASTGALCPFCRKVYQDLMTQYEGQWEKSVRHAVVKRLVLSEKDRIGIGTFQPKDEKNQDSTELTGDLNYRKIAEYGSDSDPRAFNFDGELNIANRGIIEFIEILKLDVAFLYDLLGASQEHKIKPKKFPQTDIDEVIAGHSVAGHEPIAYRLNDRTRWTTMAELHDRHAASPAGLEVLACDPVSREARWTPVVGLFRHRFTGEMLTTDQKWGVVETTPNHSIYSRGGETFYPEERREVLALRRIVLQTRAWVEVEEQFTDGLPRSMAAGGVGRPVTGAVMLSSDDATALSVVTCNVAQAVLSGGITRLPDFIFDLPLATRAAILDLVHDRARGTFVAASPMLAAQVGLLASSVELDYSVERPGNGRELRIALGTDGRAQPAEARLHRRPAFNEWVYDIECEGLHNFVCGVGSVVCHNTNEPEYRKLQNNELMEAFRDRTVKIDVPYNSVWQEEVKIYARDFNARQIRGKHIAPHTIEMAAMWAVLTRLEEPKKAQITLLQKMKLYGGKTLPGFTEDNIRELREEAPREGMDGISPRYIQDKISNALVRDDTGLCVNPFMVLNELESGLYHHSLITREETRKRYRELLSMVKQEYEDVVKNEVQKAISADEEAIARLCGNYVDNIKAYTFHEKVRNKFTGQEDDPDERMMRSIEEKIDISESRKDDFRREIMNYIAALALEGKQFDYKTNERLQKALELKLFEDQKDSIKLTSLVSAVVDRDTQEKIDIVKGRLIKNYGYCEVCSVDVLNYVASIFARGDSKQR